MAINNLNTLLNIAKALSSQKKQKNEAKAKEKQASAPASPFGVDPLTVLDKAAIRRSQQSRPEGSSLNYEAEYDNIQSQLKDLRKKQFGSIAAGLAVNPLLAAYQTDVNEIKANAEQMAKLKQRSAALKASEQADIVKNAQQKYRESGSGVNTSKLNRSLIDRGVNGTVLEAKGNRFFEGEPMEWLTEIDPTDLKDPDFYIDVLRTAQLINKGDDGQTFVTAITTNLHPEYERYMSAEEIGTYNYLWENESRKAAREYLNSLKGELNQRRTEQSNAKWSEYAGRNAGTAAAASAASVGLNLLGAPASTGEILKQNAIGALTGKYGVDYNQTGGMMAQNAEAVRGSVMDKYNWKLGEWDTFDTVYGSGMSLLDSLAAAATGGAFGKASNIVSSLILGTSAASGTARDIVSRGGTDDQALAGAIAAGAFETLFEKVSIGNFKALQEVSPAGFKDVAKNVLKSVTVNASEEAVTELANILYDTVALGDISNWELSVQNYMDQGLSEEQAKAQTAQDMVLQIGEAALGGALIGGGMAGVGSTIGWLKNRKNQTVSESETAALNTLTDISSRQTAGTSTIADAVAEKVLTGQAPTNSEIRQLYAASGPVRAQFSEMTGIEIAEMDQTQLRAALSAAAKSPAITEERISELEETGLMEQAQNSLNSPEAVDNYFRNAVNAPAAQQAKQNDAADYIMSGSAVPTAPDVAQSFREGRTAAKTSANTVTVGEGADFSSLDISNKRKSQLSAASAVFGKLGVQADIDVKGDILAQTGAQVYTRIKNSPAVSRALSEYFGGQWSEFSTQEKADHAARFIGEAVRKEAAGEKLNSSEKAVMKAVENTSKGAQNAKSEHNDINSPKNRLAGAKVELDYAQMKAKEYGNARFGGTKETRDRFDMWNNEVKRLQKEVAQLEEQVGDTVSEDEDNAVPKFMARKSDASQRDAEYLAAVEAGDMETAQRMVDEAAKAVGYTIKAYHGTGHKFTVFDRSMQGDNYGGWGRLGKGFYFAPSKKDAKIWAERSAGNESNIMSVYLNGKNLLDVYKELPENLIKKIPEEWDSLTKRLAQKYAGNFIEYLQEFGYNIQDILVNEGYDGLKAHDSEYVLYNPEQIKSAEAVTYDKDGKVIPLSERFNDSKTDIRFATRGKAKAKINPRTENAKNGSVELVTNIGTINVPTIDPLIFTHGDAELTSSYRKVERLAKSFNKELVWMAGSSVTLDGKEYGVEGGFYYKGKLYLNIENMTEGYTMLFGHELCHDMVEKDRRNNGGKSTLLSDYYNLRRAWAEKNGTTDAFEARVNDIINNRVFDDADPDAVFEEFMCDDLGTFMMNEDFARFAIAEKRSLWQKITYAIGNFIKRLKGLGAKKGEVRELEQLHAFMLSALDNYRTDAQRNAAAAPRSVADRLSGINEPTAVAPSTLTRGIRRDARLAEQLVKDSQGRYKPREYRNISPAKWQGSTSESDSALAGVTARNAPEVDSYGYRKVSDGQSEYRVYVTNPNSPKLNKQHKDNIKAVRAFAAATGTRVGFTTGKAIMTAKEGNEYLYKYDAINDNGTVYVNLDAADPYTAIVGAHWYNQYAAANPARARTLARTIKRMNKLTGGKTTAQDMAVKQITSSERSSYALLPRTQMSAEALKMTSADLLATLSRDKSLAKSVAKEQPSLIRRALDVTGDMLSRLTGTTEERAKKLMQQAEANLLYALNSSAENNTTPEGSKISTTKKKPLPEGMRAMSIKTMEDGTRYVEVDTDQARFDGLSLSAMQREAKRVIIGKFKNKVVGDNEKRAFVNKRSAEEYAYPAKFLDDKTKESKMRASTELDSLMNASVYLGHEDDDGRHPDAINGWRKYSTVFKVGNHFWGGEISVKGTEHGWVFYDFTKIKDITEGISDLHGERPSVASNDNVSNTNIPHPSDDVKFSALRNPTRQENRAWLDEYSEQYGAIPEGENVNSRGNQNVPKQIDDDTRTRQTARTYLEALSTPDAVVGEVEKDIINGRFSYTPVSNVAANQNADRILARGYDEAMAEWQGVVHGDRIADKKSIALGERLIIEAANRGDTAAATRMIAEVAAEATRAGQIVQAISMVKRLSPAGQLLSIQRQVNKLNDELARRGKEVSISEDKLKEFTDLAKQLEKAQQRISELEEMLENGQERTENGYTEDELADAKEQEQQLKEKLGEAKNDIIKDVAKKVPPSWVDKLNAWRYLAMLGNPRTHIRNLIGNAVFIPTVKLKQAMASGLEHVFVKKGNRTQSVVAPKSIREFAARDAAEQLEWLKSGGKYNATDEISEQTKSFSDKNVVGKALNKVSDFNSWALDAEDGIFLKYHYQTALAGYAAANGISAYQFENDEKLLQKARDFAAREAQRATYRDMNAFSDFMTQASRKLRAKQGMGGALAYAAFEGVVPFKKTPCNIVKRSIEYSPIGVMNSLWNGARKLLNNRKGIANDYTASEFINDLSAGMTGTMIVALGALLSSLGMLRGRNKDKEDEFEKLQGAQEYSLVIGDWSYTIDWMSPVALPLFVGAELHDQITNTNEELTLKSLLNSLVMISEPIFNLSMMDGVQSVLQSYSSEGAIVDMFTGAVESFAGQMFPTIGGQIARTIDPKTRNAYYNDKNSGVPEFLSQTVRSAMSKTPFLQSKLPERIDAWGRNSGEGQGLFERAAENFFSPGYYSKSKTTEVDRVIQQIYKETGDSGVFPSVSSKSFSLDGETYYLSADEYVEFAKTEGNTAYDTINELKNTRAFKNADTATKAEWIKNVYDFAHETAKARVLDEYIPKGDAGRIAALSDYDISYAEFLCIKSQAGSSQAGLYNALQKSQLSQQQCSALWSVYNSGWKKTYEEFQQGAEK